MGLAYGRANRGCPLDGFLRPDACCFASRFQAEKGLVGDECDWPGDKGGLVRVADGWASWHVM